MHAQQLLQQGIEQRAKAVRSSRERPRMSAQTYPAPFQHCQSGDSGNRCELMPADPGDGGAAQRATRPTRAGTMPRPSARRRPCSSHRTTQGLLTTTLAAGNRSQQDNTAAPGCGAGTAPDDAER